MSSDRNSAEAHLEDAAVVARARGGEHTAWEHIVRRHQEAVFRYAYLQLGDPAEAEDVAQETFVRAYRAIGRFDAARPLRPWLLRITRNLSRNRFRSWARRWRAVQRWTDEVRRAADVADDPTEGSLRAAAVSLREVVQRMKETDRQVIYLRFFLDLSLEETGEALGVPIGTVKSRLSRALGRLRATVRRDHPSLREALEG